MASSSARDATAADALHARRAGSTSAVWGYVIVLAAGLSFLSSMYMMFFSTLPARLLPLDDEQHQQQRSAPRGILAAIEEDAYYCYLLPLTIPVSILAFYANWVSLKFFRHN